MIKERTAIHGNIDPALLYPDIKVSQDMYIQPVLGSALFDKLQTLVDTGDINLTENADYYNLISKFIADALMYYTLSALPTTISYQFWNKGVVRKYGEETELPSMSELIDLSNMYKNRGEFYANRLKVYLMQNASLKFREYLNPGSGIDTVYPDRDSFTMPVYLGDEETDDCRCKNNWKTKPYNE